LSKCIFEFMINTASQRSNNVNGRQKFFKIINFKNQTVQGWSLMMPLFLRKRKLGYRFKSRRGYFQFFFLFFFFRRIFTLWLVSLCSHCWSFLASRDFCDNVFLVLSVNLKRCLISSSLLFTAVSSPMFYWTR